MKELQAITRALAAEDASSAVLATLVKVEGSSYRRAGARLLVLPDGRRIGSISGGCLEEDILARAGQVTATGEPQSVMYDTTSENDLVWGVGLGCHGVVRVFIEKLQARPAWALHLTDCFASRRHTTISVTHAAANPADLGTTIGERAAGSSGEVFVEIIAPPVHLCVLGAGDDAQPLVRLAKELGWQVTVADPRPAFATPARFPQADKLVVAPADCLVTKLSIDPQSVAVVMTHHYVHDVPMLRSLLPLSLPYIGLLGPKKRAAKILADIASSGFAPTPDQRRKLHAPVGLDLGADGPEQVALSIIAEIQAVLTDRDGRPLRERASPIHAAILPNPPPP